MLKSLEIVNKWALEVHEKRMKLTDNDNKQQIVLDNQIDKLIRIKQDLEVLNLLLPYLFEVDYDDSEPLIGIYDLINRDLSISDRLDIKIWLESNKLGDNYD